jgi:hypothetical protein
MPNQSTPSTSFEAKDIIIGIVIIAFMFCLCCMRNICNSDMFSVKYYLNDRIQQTDNNIIIRRIDNKNIAVSSFIV